ncbi:hypothetical protein EHI8A_084870 [Entamoeba histolytica HM-1:IMSS-B]|uniref:Uncharacterized protein n=6 Tax=Entamoeba histolytica TaxID=5759 RepID=C4M946_ENTH1|nr:hypothetical protein EHI_083620 [Entamoeba histolytica HM-1:IMSS]EMD48424.1 Hypothetical protein EHI5A_037320 [Entamoeba histolytica KU27]EMH78026.1 hypothetical protein EHI8A_084870 [Entamoeba histolytica HM-1:IMSS-B]EMS15811.1 hypothetical protein KM1_120830 [Entamoeba histolytica HM-3:IMSS]ENY64067.1 hypothetical protein EHI7A_062150 [Entamoeba histolytica HM-1:IMSS-A]GAT98167.1 hypothetical protein CL6EHI_083620 [Entamoeba histolytica]|eukprot:XP_654422.1 hypothetical protein EHI_083620 [Entamoeba histolytica HM-1:IMSS]
MSSEEDNQNLVKCAEEICEVFADSVSSLVLMLVALQEKNKPPRPEMQMSIQSVAEQSDNIGQIAKDLAEEDYEEYPDIQKEILDAAEEVFTGSSDLTQAANNLKTSNLKEGYQQLVDGCRICGTNCIKLLQIVYGATFKKLAAEQEKMRELAEQMDTKLVDEDPQRFADIAGDLCSAGLQIAEDMRTQADGEAVPSDKAEMQELADNIEKYSNELLDTVNAYLEDPDNEKLRVEMEEAKERLMKEMEKAKERVAKSQEIVKKQQEALNAQTAAQNASIDEKIKNSKPIVPKEEQVKTGLSVLENLDKAGEAVFWNNPKDFVSSTNENMQEIPKFVDGRIADARNEKNPEKEEEAKKIKEDFQTFVDNAKTAFSEPENDAKKEAAIQSYKEDRARIVKELQELGVEDIPEQPQVEEATFDIEDESIIANSEQALKTMPKDKLDKLKNTYKQIEAMEYAVDNGDNNAFISNAKPVINDVQQAAQIMNQEAVKNKDVKKKKIAENLSEDLAPSINDSKASLVDKENKAKKEKAKQSLEKLKEDVVDALVVEGITKKQAEKALSEKERNEELIKELLTMKQAAVEMQDAVNNKNTGALAKNAKEALTATKATVPKMKETAQKQKEPLLDAYADNIQRKLVPAINDSNTFIKDSKDEKKAEQANKAITEYIEAIDDALRECKATPDEMQVAVKVKEDSEVTKKAEKTKECTKKARDCLFNGDLDELEDAMAELDGAQDEMLRTMIEDAKKSGRKDDVKKIKDTKEEYEKASEEVKKAKKDPKDKEQRQKASEKLRKYQETLDKIMEDEGKPIKETEKTQNKVDEDLELLREGIENVDSEKVKEANNKLTKDFEKYKAEKEKEGQNVDDVLIPVKEAQAAAVTAARDPKNIIKRKKAVDSIKKCRNKLYNKPEEVKSDEKQSKEDLKEIEEIEELADSIILNDDEEARLLIEEIAKASRRVAEALEEENEEKLKSALEELEKKKKMKDNVINKAIERCPEEDRKLLKQSNEKIDKLSEEQIELAKQALEDGNMKEKASKAKKNSGETSKVAQSMKPMLGKTSEIKAEESSKAILDDCKLAEKLAKEPNERLAKELKKKLAKDVENYENAIKDMIENADITPEEKEALLKNLEEVKKKAKEVDSNLDKLIKNPKDKQAQEDLIKSAKELNESVNKMNDNFDVEPKAKCKKTERVLDKCKEAVLCKDKEEGNKALNELDKQYEELMKSIDEAIAKEKDAKKKKELEEAKKKVQESIAEAKKATKKALDTNNDEDILDCEIACDSAKADVEKLKEKLKGGKTKGSKKSSVADRMKYLAHARKAMKDKNFAMARDDLQKLKKLLTDALDDPELDEETRNQIEDLISKIDFALEDIEHAEENGTLSEINDMVAHLNDLTGNDITEQAKAKSKARGIAARARGGKKTNLSNLVKGSRDLANKMKGLKFNVKDEAHENMDGLSDQAKAALELNDLLDNMSDGVDLDGMLGSMTVDEEPAEPPKNELESQINSVADLIKQTAAEESKPKATGKTKEIAKAEMPAVCGDIAVHFRELAKHASCANKEGIIVEGRTIAAAIGQFCKELQKAQPICKDPRTADDMARSLQALRNLSTQLKIVCSVKAATVGKGDTEGDNQLIAICQNIGNNMKGGMETLAVANRTKLLKN